MLPRLLCCYALSLLFAVLILTWSSHAGPPSPGVMIPLSYPDGTRILVEIADTNEKRARGLMFREHMANGHGMLFVFEEPGQWTFWMKNTKIPLDMLWLDQNKRIVDITENIPGCVQEPCLQYQPSKAASYVLEVPAGSVKRQKLAKGMQLSFQVPKNKP
jgi:uncharacterized membrane protein (UPF0127 family)